MNKLWLRWKRALWCTAFGASLITLKSKVQFVLWEWRGRPGAPPDPFKHRLLTSIARQYGLSILVETGTYTGKTVAAIEHAFDRVYTIEVDAALYEAARKRFAQSQKIEVIHGDSGIALGELMGRIDRPALFWLDAHYSWGFTGRGQKDVPVLEELMHISNGATASGGHVILIDDIRSFDSDPMYPVLEEVRKAVAQHLPDYDFKIEHDIMRITPPDAPRN